VGAVFYLYVEEMFSARQKMVCILWLTEPKSYTHVWHKLNQGYPNQIALIYRYVLHWNESLKESGSTLWQLRLPQCTVSQGNVDWIHKAFQKSVHQTSSQSH